MMLNGARIKVLKVSEELQNGPVATFVDDHLTIACGQNALQLLTLQREGKSVTQAQDFLRGFPVPKGTKAA